MTWLTPILDFVASLLVKLAGPVLAFFAGKGYEQKKEAQRESAKEKLRADNLSQAIRISDSVDNRSDDDLERLRTGLNNRP